MMMKTVIGFAILWAMVVVVFPAKVAAAAAAAADDDLKYVNEWVMEVEGGEDVARALADRYGFHFFGRMHTLDNHYVLRHKDLPHRSKRSAEQHTSRLTNDRQVKWAQQQVVLRRAKRGHQSHFRRQRSIMDEECLSNNTSPFNDPKFPCQWYMSSPAEQGRFTSDVQDVWAMGITGKGVVVTVVDDGLEVNHTDLAANYDPDASYDINDDDPDPMPRYEYDGDEENKHGTRCAGEIAMVANNSKCGVGVAYNCKIGGIRLLDGKVTALSEANSLSFNCLNHTDIYSLSWGPTDDGKTMEEPNTLVIIAMKKCIEEGRSGKGVIYVLASGNGGSHDDCNCDGYASSMYTLSISSFSHNGTQPYYGEKCPSTIASAPSSGSGYYVFSTDLLDKCTLYHSGTSASAPLCAGAIALVLEANPDLTWRDVQHLVVLTSKPDQVADKANHFCKNHVGFPVSQAFGFGLIDPKDMVIKALNWTLVPNQIQCNVSTVRPAISEREYVESMVVKTGSGVTVTLHLNSSECHVRYLEHVQFFLSLNYTCRGAIDVYVISPRGTKTQLLHGRKDDKTNASYDNWPLMSVHTWGEDPNGTWTFVVEDKSGMADQSGQVLDVRMIVYGTEEAPGYRQGYTEPTFPDIKACTDLSFQQLEESGEGEEGEEEEEADDEKNDDGDDEGEA